jgi:hypothetical protein
MEAPHACLTKELITLGESGQDGPVQEMPVHIREEVAMPIVVVFQTPTLTQEKYEQTVRKLTGGKRSRMESMADWPVEGLLVHAAGQSAEGFRVVDIWQSEDAFRRFGEKLLPILKEVGVEGAPEIYQAHAFVSA